MVMAEEIEEEVQKKSGGNMVLILIIVLLVVLLVGGAVAAFFLLGSDDESAANQSGQQMSSSTTQKKIKRSTDYLSIGPMYPMSEFIVNLLSESGSRYLKVALDIELDSENLAAEMDKKKSLIRDIVIRSLSSKTFEEVSTIKGKDRLKDEIVTKINDILADGQIRNIFFTDFVVQ
jgi:flagellar FliL protein